MKEKDEQRRRGLWGEKRESVRTKGDTQKMRRCTPQCGMAPDPIAMPRGSQRVSTNYEIISTDTRHLPEISPYIDGPYRDIYSEIKLKADYMIIGTL